MRLNIVGKKQKKKRQLLPKIRSQFLAPLLSTTFSQPKKWLQFGRSLSDPNFKLKLISIQLQTKIRDKKFHRKPVFATTL